MIIYQKPTPDYLPSIDACLLTGITPQIAMEKGSDEVEFLNKILKEFMVPNTTVAGFNSINFDDEFIRNDLYKNLFDPYRREYINGCSRWDIINLVRQLKENREAIISNQIGRSGTSIGANIHEAQYAQGKKDFVSKLEIALKEASETGYWLELLHRTNYIDEQLYKSLSAKCTSLRVMLIASCRTAKENTK